MLASFLQNLGLPTQPSKCKASKIKGNQRYQSASSLAVLLVINYLAGIKIWRAQRSKFLPSRRFFIFFIFFLSALKKTGERTSAYFDPCLCEQMYDYFMISLSYFRHFLNDTTCKIYSFPELRKQKRAKTSRWFTELSLQISKAIRLYQPWSSIVVKSMLFLMKYNNMWA